MSVWYGMLRIRDLRLMCTLAAYTASVIFLAPSQGKNPSFYLGHFRAQGFRPIIKTLIGSKISKIPVCVP